MSRALSSPVEAIEEAEEKEEKEGACCIFFFYSDPLQLGVFYSFSSSVIFLTQDVLFLVSALNTHYSVSYALQTFHTSLVVAMVTTLSTCARIRSGYLEARDYCVLLRQKT